MDQKKIKQDNEAETPMVGVRISLATVVDTER